MKLYHHHNLPLAQYKLNFFFSRKPRVRQREAKNLRTFANVVKLRRYVTG